MKKIAPVFLAAIMCFALCSCGNSTITGDPVTYSNADQSFSIDLPTANEEFWVVNEKAAGDVLDISDNKDNINIQIQCLSKGQAQYIAEDFAAYQDYAMVNILGDLVSNMEFKDSKVEVPDFAINSKTQSFTLKEGSNTVKGDLVFLETDKCYYTYLIMAIDEAYDGNEGALHESLLSLKEITDATPKAEPKSKEAE